MAREHAHDRTVLHDNVKHTLSYVHAVHRVDKAVHTGASSKWFQRTQIVEICAAREHAHVQHRKRQRETHLSYVLAVHLVGKAVHNRVASGYNVLDVLADYQS